MSNNRNAVEDLEPIKEVKEPTAQDFQVKYEALCKEMGMLIVPSLAWIMRDDNTWSTKCNLTIGKIPSTQE